MCGHAAARCERRQESRLPGGEFSLYVRSRAIVCLSALGKVVCSSYVTVVYGVADIHQQILVPVHVNATATWGLQEVESQAVNQLLSWRLRRALGFRVRRESLFVSQYATSTRQLPLPKKSPLPWQWPWPLVNSANSLYNHTSKIFYLFAAPLPMRKAVWDKRSSSLRYENRLS